MQCVRGQNPSLQFVLHQLSIPGTVSHGATPMHPPEGFMVVGVGVICLVVVPAIMTDMSRTKYLQLCCPIFKTKK